MKVVATLFGARKKFNRSSSSSKSLDEGGQDIVLLCLKEIVRKVFATSFAATFTSSNSGWRNFSKAESLDSVRVFEEKLNLLKVTPNEVAETDVSVLWFGLVKNIENSDPIFSVETLQQLIKAQTTSEVRLILSVVSDHHIHVMAGFLAALITMYNKAKDETEFYFVGGLARSFASCLIWTHPSTSNAFIKLFSTLAGQYNELFPSAAADAFADSLGHPRSPGSIPSVTEWESLLSGNKKAVRHELRHEHQEQPLESDSKTKIAADGENSATPAARSSSSSIINYDTDSPGGFTVSTFPAPLHRVSSHSLMEHESSSMDPALVTHLSVLTASNNLSMPTQSGIPQLPPKSEATCVSSTSVSSSVAVSAVGLNDDDYHHRYEFPAAAGAVDEVPIRIPFPLAATSSGMRADDVGATSVHSVMHTTEASIDALLPTATDITPGDASLSYCGDTYHAGGLISALELEALFRKCVLDFGDEIQQPMADVLSLSSYLKWSLQAPVLADAILMWANRLASETSDDDEAVSCSVISWPELVEFLRVGGYFLDLPASHTITDSTVQTTRCDGSGERYLDTGSFTEAGLPGTYKEAELPGILSPASSSRSTQKFPDTRSPTSEHAKHFTFPSERTTPISTSLSQLSSFAPPVAQSISERTSPNAIDTCRLSLPVSSAQSPMSRASQNLIVPQPALSPLSGASADGSYFPQRIVVAESSGPVHISMAGAAIDVPARLNPSPASPTAVEAVAAGVSQAVSPLYSVDLQPDVLPPLGSGTVQVAAAPSESDGRGFFGAVASRVQNADTTPRDDATERERYRSSVLVAEIAAAAEEGDEASQMDDAAAPLSARGNKYTQLSFPSPSPFSPQSSESLVEHGLVLTNEATFSRAHLLDIDRFRAGQVESTRYDVTMDTESSEVTPRVPSSKQFLDRAVSHQKFSLAQKVRAILRIHMSAGAAFSSPELQQQEDCISSSASESNREGLEGGCRRDSAAENRMLEALQRSRDRSHLVDPFFAEFHVTETFGDGERSVSEVDPTVDHAPDWNKVLLRIQPLSLYPEFLSKIIAEYPALNKRRVGVAELNEKKVPQSSVGSSLLSLRNLSVADALPLFGGLAAPAVISTQSHAEPLGAFAVATGVAFCGVVERKTSKGQFASRFLVLYGPKSRIAGVVEGAAAAPGVPQSTLCVFASFVETQWGKVPINLKRCIPADAISRVTMDTAPGTAFKSSVKAMFSVVIKNELSGAGDSQTVIVSCPTVEDRVKWVAWIATAIKSVANQQP